MYTKQSTTRGTERSSPRPGDVIHVSGRRVGDAKRLGEIVEVLGEPPTRHYRVRWEDGRESIFYPGSDSHVVTSGSPSEGRTS